jgi:hypothetical protein
LSLPKSDRLSNSSKRESDLFYKSFDTSFVNEELPPAPADQKQVRQNMEKLSISCKLYPSQTDVNPFLRENDRSHSPAPSLSNSVFTSVSQRSLFTPPRLHSQSQNNQNALYSWIAGGYWVPAQNNLYYQKSSSSYNVRNLFSKQSAPRFSSFSAKLYHNLNTNQSNFKLYRDPKNSNEKELKKIL